MPIYIVGNDVFETNEKLDCVLCPFKANEYNHYKRYEKIIFDKVGEKELRKLFCKAHPFEINTPFITDGLSLSRRIMHVIANEMSFSKDFVYDMYYLYDNVFKLAMDLNISTFIFPCVPYGYKRKGEMNTYKTCISMCKHLMNLYNPDFSIFIVVNEQAIYDHVYDYDPHYVSTSFPLSKRHKPIKYPLTSMQEADEYRKDNGHFRIDTKYLLRRNYFINKVSENYLSFYNLIKRFFKDDASFCFYSNISKRRYILFIQGYIKPTKEELISSCIALNLSLIETIEILKIENYSFDKSPLDEKLIEFINEEKFDVFSINETLYTLKLKQIGSPISYVYNVD